MWQEGTTTLLPLLPELRMNKNIIRDLELILEVQELRDLGLTDDEVIGFVDMYSSEWELDNGSTFKD